MRRQAVVGGVAVAVLVAGAAGGLWWRHGKADKEADRAAASEVAAFAQAWQKRSFTGPGLRFAGSTGASVGADFATATQGLGTGPVTVSAGPTQRDGDRATSTLKVT